MGIHKTLLRNVGLILILLIGLWLPTRAQNVGTVKVTANPPIVCPGEPTTLHAYWNNSSETLVYDFESGTEGWTTIDADGHGDAWSRTTSTGYNSSCCMRAQYNSSYDHNDYLVSPKITLGIGKVSFYAKRSSTTWDDTFRVYLSTTGNTSASSFTIQLTSGNVLPSSNFTKYQFDLSGYSGEGYVAIVYTAEANQGWLYVDQVSFYDESTGDEGTTYGFENHTFQGWTRIDADGDGHNWELGTVAMAGYLVSGFGDSEDMVVSESYDKTNDYGDGVALFPDNYLVCPSKLSIQSGAFISFWACAQDATWSAEHFGVAISTKGKTNPNDFTTIQSWTMTAKSSGRSAGPSRSGNREQGSWYKYTVDLSAYVGQQIWVALRHFNCTDMFYLDVDDITLYAGASNPNSQITYEWNNGQVGQDITVFPNETTSYMVTVKNNGTIVARGRQIVVVRPLSPQVTITTDPEDPNLCEGGEITITANVAELPVYFTPGDILCADGSVVKRSDWNNSMTAKGVVFYVDATGQHGWAIDLGTITAKKKWSTENVAIPGLQQYSLWYDAISDMDGMTNTTIIRNFGTSAKYPAAFAVDVDNGWYMPTAGQLNVLFGELIVVNNSLAMVGGNSAKIKTGNDEEIWSSDICTYNQFAMTMFPKNGRIGYQIKSDTRYVRQVIDF